MCWTLQLIGWLSPFCLLLFLEFWSVLSFGVYFFVSSIWQPPCVCFCVLGRAALTPCLSSVTYWRKSICKLCGTEPYVIAWVGQPTSLLWGSVWEEGSGRGQCHSLAFGGCPFYPFLPIICPISSHFTHFLYVTGALPAVALVLCPRVGGFVYVVSSCRPFIWSLLKVQEFLPLPSPLLVFIARSYGDLSSWHWDHGLCSLAWGWDHLLPRYPSWVLPTAHECGTVYSAAPITSPRCTASRCLSTHLCNSTPPTHLHECGFFKSLVVVLPYSSIFWWFWVLFVLRSSCNSFCVCTRKQSVYTYTSILTGSVESDFLNW